MFSCVFIKKFIYCSILLNTQTQIMKTNHTKIAKDIVDYLNANWDDLTLTQVVDYTTYNRVEKLCYNGEKPSFPEQCEIADYVMNSGFTRTDYGIKKTQ